MIVSFVNMILDRFLICFFVFIFCVKTGVTQIDTIRVFGKELLLEELYRNSDKDNFIKCEVGIGAKKVAAKIRVRGDSSRKFDKKSLKIKFYINGGIQTLNLNAEYKDRSYMHQHLSAFIFRNTGVPTFKTEYKVLMINNEFKGIYLQVENIDTKFLKRNNLNVEGNLYKAKKDGANLSVFDDVIGRWQKNSNNNGDKKGLHDLIINLNQVPDSCFLRFVKKAFDYDNLISSIAINSLIGNGSTYYHNYFLFHDITGSGKWMYFPWDMDKSMGSYDTRLPYYYSSWSSKIHGGQPENPLVYRLLHDKKGFSDYKEKIKFLSKTIFNTSKLLPEIKILKKQLAPYIASDKQDDIPSIKYWEKEVEKIVRYIKEKPKVQKSQFQEFPSLFSLNNEAGYQFDKTVRLSWEESKTNIDSIVYHLKISPSKVFKSGVIEYKNLRKTNIVIDSLEPGRYYWHVVADNGKFKVNGFNARNYFDVGKAVILGGEIKGEKVIKNAQVVIWKDLKIGKNSSLTFGEGVTVKLNPKVRIFNKGVLRIIGHKNQPVVLTNRKKEKGWLGIFSTGYLEINYAYFSGVIGESVVRQIDGTAKMQNTLSQYNSVRETVSFNKCPVIINDNVVKNSKGEGLLFLKCSGIVKRNSLFGIPDAIEATYCKDLLITENFMIDASDDGIDVNFGSNVYVTHNTAINCKDKGMSITSTESDSTIFFEHNYIQNCTRGIGVEGKGVVNLNKNIYYNNKEQLFLETTKGLTVYSNGEHFNTLDKIDIHVDISNQKTFSKEYLDGLNIEMKVDKNKNKVNSITLISKHTFPISLKGVSIRSGKKVLYQFNEHEIIFPSEKLILRSSQSKKIFKYNVLNDVKAKKKIKLFYKNETITQKIKKSNYWSYVVGFVLLTSVVGLLIIKKKK
tara:strand:- start:8975 stop:11683 length:2709 start_codon:yes stop_codon:yes gene_type:complete